MLSVKYSIMLSSKIEILLLSSSSNALIIYKEPNASLFQYFEAKEKHPRTIKKWWGRGN